MNKLAIAIPVALALAIPSWAQTATSELKQNAPKVEVVTTPVKPPVVESKTPTLSDAQKLELRNAQLAFLQAQIALMNNDLYKAYAKATDDLNTVTAKIYTDGKIDRSKWGLNDKLEFYEMTGGKK